MISNPNRRAIAIKCVVSQKLSDAVWTVLMAIASRIGKDGDCYPSIETISREANGRSASTVKRAIKDAVRLGLLRKYRKNVGGKSLMHYSITPIAVPIRFDKSKQSWSEFVKANTRHDYLLPGENRTDFVAPTLLQRITHPAHLPHICPIE